MTLDAAELDRLVIAAGESWALEAAAHLREEERAVAGGWPGTLSEARARVAELVRGSIGAYTPDVFERLTRLAYATARKAWAAQAVAETND
jgi:hypothetical protein